MKAAPLSLTEQLMVVAEAFCAATDIRLGTLSARYLGRGSRLQQMRDGETTITIVSYEAALDRLSVDWPETAEWPDGVDRPDPVLAAARLAASTRGASAAQSAVPS